MYSLGRREETTNPYPVCGELLGLKNNRMNSTSTTFLPSLLLSNGNIMSCTRNADGSSNGSNSNSSSSSSISSGGGGGGLRTVTYPTIHSHSMDVPNFSKELFKRGKAFDEKPSFKLSKERRKVSFASKLEMILHFLPGRPVYKIKQPILQLQIEPINCNGLVQSGTWLSDVTSMRKEPYCRLDFLCGKILTIENNNDDHISNYSKTTSQGGENDEPDFPFSPDYFIGGEVAVYNLEYEKRVLIHFTFDEWITKFSVIANYSSSVGALRIDKFSFSIPVPSNLIQFSKLELAIEYQVSNKTYWDNMGGQNYHFSFKEVPFNFEEGGGGEKGEKEDKDINGDRDESFDLYHPPIPPIPSLIPPPVPILKGGKPPLVEKPSHSIPIPLRKPISMSTPSSYYYLSSYSSNDCQVRMILPTQQLSSSSPLGIGGGSLRFPKKDSIDSSNGGRAVSSSWDCTKSFTLIAMSGRPASIDRKQLENVPMFIA